MFPVCSGHEIRRDFYDLVAAAVPTPLDGREMARGLPFPCLDLLWCTDPSPEAEGFLHALRRTGRSGAALVARSAVEEVAAELPADDAAGATLRRLLSGEVLESSQILILAFEDRERPCLGWIAQRVELLSLLDRLRRIADLPTAVLLTGETGTGKEVIARALHRLGRRVGHPWLAINCAELPEGILESELFGHVRGAFTGAGSDRAGLLESAGAGTAFLDEVGELPRPAQAKLLRVLEDHRVRPLGSSRSRPLRCRILAATNRDLAEEVRRGDFRADLFFRLRGTEIPLSPLRERPRDVLALARSFTFRAGLRFGRVLLGISAEAEMALVSHAWPGNVRELRQSVDAAVLASDGEWLRLPDLRLVDEAPPPCDEPSFLPVHALERMQIVRALATTNGNKVAAARLLGLTRQSLQRRIERHRITKEPGGGRPRPEPVTDSGRPRLREPQISHRSG